jgi:hypothetical protein
VHWRHDNSRDKHIRKKPYGMASQTIMVNELSVEKTVEILHGGVKVMRTINVTIDEGLLARPPWPTSILWIISYQTDN